MLFNIFWHLALAGVVSKQKGTPAVSADLRRNTNIEEVLADVQTKLNISAENSFFDLSTSGLFTTVCLRQLMLNLTALRIVFLFL
jgi:hypothetical protein